MSLFDKFNNFNVNTEDRIASEDKLHLEHFQEIYNSTLLYYKRVYALYLEEQRKYTAEDKEKIGKYSSVFADDLDVFKEVQKLQSAFSSHIYSYFSNKYHVDLDSRKTSDKYERMRLYNPSEEEIKELYEPRTYDVVLDDIIGQLGGMTFADVATQQIKDKMKDACVYGRNSAEWRIEVKGATIKYTGWTTVRERWHGGYEVNRNDFLLHLPDALGMFAANNANWFGFNRLRGYEIELSYDELKSGISFPEGYKLALIKFFKNGNISLKFETPEYAREFARIWCGYTLI